MSNVDRHCYVSTLFTSRCIPEAPLAVVHELWSWRVLPMQHVKWKVIGSVACFFVWYWFLGVLPLTSCLRTHFSSAFLYIGRNRQGLHTHTHARKHTDTRAHARTHAHTHTHTHTRHTHTHARTHAHTHTHTRTWNRKFKEESEAIGWCCYQSYQTDSVTVPIC